MGRLATPFAGLAGGGQRPAHTHRHSKRSTVAAAQVPARAAAAYGAWLAKQEIHTLSHGT